MKVYSRGERAAMRYRRWIELLLVLIAVSLTGMWLKPPSEPTASPSPPPTVVASAKATPASQAWEPFTDAARKSIVAAQEAAAEDKSPIIDCRYLVIGLRKADPQIDAYLTVRKVDLSELRLPSGSPSLNPMETAFDAEAKRAIELGFEECRSDKSTSIDATHLFRGILRTKSETRELLNRAGVSSGDFKEWPNQHSGKSK